jgi:hypothetical protein
MGMVAFHKIPDSPWYIGDSADNRRIFERKPAEGEATGHRIDHTISARQNPRLTLNLRDLSAGGLGVLADRPLNEGEHLTVEIPRRGLVPGWDAVGRVVRCEPSAMGYRVGLEFDSRMAA